MRSAGKFFCAEQRTFLSVGIASPPDRQARRPVTTLVLLQAEPMQPEIESGGKKGSAEKDTHGQRAHPGEQEVAQRVHLGPVTLWRAKAAPDQRQKTARPRVAIVPW